MIDTAQDRSQLVTTLLNSFATKTCTTPLNILAHIRGDDANNYLKRCREEDADVTMEMLSFFQKESEQGLAMYERLNEFVAKEASGIRCRG